MNTTSDRELPPISVLIAVRNEEKHLDACLSSVAQLDYPHDKLEIIAIDGESNDNTPAILDDWRKRDARLHVFSNSRKIVAAGMNLGLQQASHDLVLWISGHVLLKPDHLRLAVETLRKTDAAAVGGVIETVGVGEAGTLNAAVLSSRFGVGSPPHRVGSKSGWVPAVTMALYRREAILAVGGFDESLPRNQDVDLHGRLNERGFRSYLDVRMTPVYLCRDTLVALLKQAYDNGFWTIMLSRMGLSGLSLRHFVPLAFITCLVILGLTAFYFRTAALALAGMMAVYLLAALVATALATRRNRLGWRALALPLWYFLLHVAYGAGSGAALFTPKHQQV